MNGVRRALARAGEKITLRRVTGTQRVPFDVICRALVTIGGATALVGGVQQTADRVLMTADELDAARWRGPPRHGDQVIFDDGTIAIVQRRAARRLLSHSPSNCQTKTPARDRCRLHRGSTSKLQHRARSQSSTAI
jgi:hypothetical protein